MAKYRIKHTYRETIILPLIGFIDNNIDFLLNNEKKQIITADGFLCDVIKYNVYNICQLEQDIKDIYNIDCWSFIKKWYNVDNAMDSLSVVKMKLKKIE